MKSRFYERIIALTYFGAHMCDAVLVCGFDARSCVFFLHARTQD